MNYDTLLATLQGCAEEKYKTFNDGIVNSGLRSMGVRLPTVRKIAKDVSLDEALSYPVNEWLEVDTVVGMAVSGAKLPFADKAPLLVRFADIIENWAVCDCNTVKVPRTEQAQYFEFFRTLARSEKPFVCRYGLVNLLSNFLDDEHIDGVFDVLADVKPYGEYYVDMAAAWLVATAAAKCRDKTFDFLTGRGREVLNVFTYNKALQKMRDSYRISAEDKAATYALKR